MKTLVGSNRGYSAIDLMIGVSLMVVVIGGFAAIYHFHNQTYQHTIGKTTGMELLREIKLKMSFKPLCDHNLQNRVLNNSGELSLNQLVDGDNKIIFGQNQKLNSSTLLVGFKIKTPAALWASYKKAASSNTAPYYPVNSTFEVSIRNNSLFAGKAFTQNILLPLNLDRDGRIQECLGFSSDLLLAALAKHCESLGAYYDQAKSSCVLSENCKQIEANKPVSQKCLASQLEKLKERIAGQVIRLPTPGATPVMSLTEKMKLSIGDCFRRSNSTSERDSELHCSLGQGYSVSISTDSVRLSTGMGVKRTYAITDPEISKEFFEYVKKIYDERN